MTPTTHSSQCEVIPTTNSSHMRREKATPNDTNYPQNVKKTLQANATNTHYTPPHEQTLETNIKHKRYREHQQAPPTIPRYTKHYKPPYEQNLQTNVKNKR